MENQKIVISRCSPKGAGTRWARQMAQAPRDNIKGHRVARAKDIASTTKRQDGLHETCFSHPQSVHRDQASSKAAFPSAHILDRRPTNPRPHNSSPEDVNSTTPNKNNNATTKAKQKRPGTRAPSLLLLSVHEAKPQTQKHAHGPAKRTSDSSSHQRKRCCCQGLLHICQPQSMEKQTNEAQWLGQRWAQMLNWSRRRTWPATVWNGRDTNRRLR